MPCEPILALDVPDAASARPVFRMLSGRGQWIKIGLQLFTAEGPPIVHEAAGHGFRVFLDLKLHDIPNTVAKAVESVARLPAGMLTIHACGGLEMMEAAAAAQRAARPDLLLLGVTVLTSMDEPALRATGVPGAPEGQVMRLAALASAAGIGGLVCSPQEVIPLKAAHGGRFTLVTPGIRPAGSGRDEQKRVMTPADAARAGARYIVVGRPVLRAPDPAAALDALIAELAAAEGAP